ncbi:MAG: peptide chain release factor-like protein [Patescibacteria group bacterium]
MSFPIPLPPHLEHAAEQLGIRMADISEAFTRGSGHGGQKVNKTNNCVELTHRPTGISVRVHEQREQHRNRELAYQMLIQHIIDKHASEEQQKRHEVFVQKLERRRRKPSSQKSVLLDKRLHGALKRNRRAKPPDPEGGLA